MKHKTDFDCEIAAMKMLITHILTNGIHLLHAIYVVYHLYLYELKFFHVIFSLAFEFYKIFV